MIVRLYKERFDKLLISPKLSGNQYILRKAAILAYVNLFLTIYSIITLIITLFFGFPDSSHIVLGIIFGISLIIIFKKYGNLFLSGNLLAGAWGGLFIPTTLITGGLYSDNLLWLFLAAPIAILFAGKKSGLFWLLLIIGFTTYLYMTPQYSDPNLLDKSIYNKGYIFNSYTFLFIALFTIMWIFESGKSMIINLLEAQRDELETQKSELISRNSELINLEEKLKETNQELVNFAYTASHDLKEPLRMIGMYTQLIKKRLNAQGDTSTTEFMGYVTDGVSRMQRLLDDLLSYSRLGKKQEDIKEIDLNNVLFLVIHNLTATMRDTEAAIICSRLPVVKGSSTEMIQLFQNLIANSIKFRRIDTAPQIKIQAKEQDDAYIITLEDNGIGIKSEYQEKVFNIFERLHTRTEYEGSGIGLATCRKIVNNAGGRIWLKSTEGVGTTFYFTFPKLSLN
jgi:signal transduction histidine kinase